MSLRGTAGITGIGELKPSRDPGGRTTMELMAQAALEAVRDAGLEQQDIDGLVVAMPVDATFEDVTPEIALVKFRPASKG